MEEKLAVDVCEHSRGESPVEEFRIQEKQVKTGFSTFDVQD